MMDTGLIILLNKDLIIKPTNQEYKSLDLDGRKSYYQYNPPQGE